MKVINAKLLPTEEKIKEDQKRQSEALKKMVNSEAWRWIKLWLEAQAGNDNLMRTIAAKKITDEAIIGRWFLIEEEVKSRIRIVINNIEKFK